MREFIGTKMATKAQTNARKRNWELLCLARNTTLYTNLLNKYGFKDEDIDRYRKAIHRQINLKYGFKPMKGIKPRKKK